RDRVGRRLRPATPTVARGVRAGPRADTELRARAALPVGAGRGRAGTARGRSRPAGLRRARARAVALRRPDRPARAPEATGRRGLTDRSSIGTESAQIRHRHVTGWPVSSVV